MGDFGLIPVPPLIRGARGDLMQAWILIPIILPSMQALTQTPAYFKALFPNSSELNPAFPDKAYTFPLHSAYPQIFPGSVFPPPWLNCVSVVLEFRLKTSKKAVIRRRMTAQ
jgi:hypothetical protein